MQKRQKHQLIRQYKPDQSDYDWTCWVSKKTLRSNGSHVGISFMDGVMLTPNRNIRMYHVHPVSGLTAPFSSSFHTDGPTFTQHQSTQITKPRNSHSIEVLKKHLESLLTQCCTQMDISHVFWCSCYEIKHPRFAQALQNVLGSVFI